VLPYKFSGNDTQVFIPMNQDCILVVGDCCDRRIDQGQAMRGLTTDGECSYRDGGAARSDFRKEQVTIQRPAISGHELHEFSHSIRENSGNS